MSYVTFENQEDQFEKWAKEAPGGVIINSSPNRLNPNYLVAHRPTCSSFWNHTGKRTVYSKHCFNSFAEAQQFISDNNLKNIRFGCNVCKVADIQSTIDPDLLNIRTENLLHAIIPENPAGCEKPRKIRTQDTYYFERDPMVAACTLKNADGKCELCEENAPFRTKKGNHYLEIHHVIRLADNGRDQLNNTVALCPNCHRALHYANNAEALKSKLYKKISRLKK